MAFESGKRTTLAKPVSPWDTTIYLASAPTVTSGRLYIKNDAQEERIAYTGVSGNSVTGCSRNISKTADPISSGTWLTRVAWCVVKLVAMHDQLADKQDDNTFDWDQTFEGNVIMWATDATKYGVKFKELTTAQIAALSTPPDWVWLVDSTTGQFKVKIWWSFQSMGAWATTPNASDTVAGKVEKATSGEVTAWTSTGWTGAELFVWPADLKTVTDAIITPLYFGSWADWDVTINSGTTTLTRDMYYNNLTLTSPWVLNPNWYRVFVKWTFSWTWTVSRNGNAWSAGTIWLMWSAGAGWAWWAALNAWSLGMELVWAAWWAWWYAPAVDQVWVAWVAWTATNPSMTNISSVAWWAWWAANAVIWWAWWAAAAATRWALYNYVTNPATLHQATATYAALAYKWMPSCWWGWWWWANYTSWTASWGWGGWAGSSWGFIYIRAYIWNFTWTVTAVWWAWWAWWAWLNNAPSWWWGGWAWWNWGILFRAYKTLSGDCTKTLTWWAGWAAWAWAAWWSTWTAGTAGNAWETITIAI